MISKFIGAISVKAAIQGKHREVYQVFFVKEKLKKEHNLRYIEKLAKEAKIKITYCSLEKMSEVLEDKSHGGVYAEVGAYQSYSLKEIFNKDNNYLALLYGLEDPFNLGYALRSLYASGCQGVIVNNRNWENAQSTICRSSAGASELLPIHFLQDFNEMLEEIKYNEIVVVCAQRSDAISVYEYEFPSSLLVCFGGEKRGLPKEVLAISKQNLYIPYGNDFRNALNASSAISVFSFLILQQRTK